MHYLWLALIGLVIGAIAKLFTPGRDPGGCIVTMLVGLIGIFIGEALTQAFGISTAGEGRWFIASIIGAIIFLALYHLAFGKRKT